MGSGCGDPIAEIFPSSSGQLPVPVALHARSPTLFPSIIHDWKKNVKSFFPIFLQTGKGAPSGTPSDLFPILQKVTGQRRIVYIYGIVISSTEIGMIKLNGFMYQRTVGKLTPGLNHTACLFKNSI